VSQQWEKARRSDPDPQRRSEAAIFSDLLGKFLDAEIDKIKSLTLATITATKREEAALRRRILAQLPESFDAGLALRHEQSQVDRVPQTGLPVRKMAELVVLEELRASVFEQIPALFLSAFHGGSEGSDGWFDLYVRDAAAKLKSGSEFERIWNAEQVALVRDVVESAAAQTEAIAAWLPETTKALREYGMALNALAGDLEATRGYAQAVYERACGDKALPLDFEAVVSTEGVLRFSPRNPRVPFLGRVREMAALDDFLALERPERPFAWWLITGGGGAGKTRLARQLILRAHLGCWRAGFLPRGFKAEVATLDAWLPQRATLIVADYVTERRSEIRTLAARLGRRGDLPPVRLLLLEREAGEEFERLFLGNDHTDRGVIEAAWYNREPLAVPELSEEEIWALVETCPWRDDGATPEIARDDFFDRLEGLDRQRRALVAMILADASAVASEDAGFDGLEEELRRLLARDRDHLWPQTLGVVGRPIGSAEADVAIAFATMVDGLGEPELAAIASARGAELDRIILPDCARAIGKPLSRRTSQLGRLEPDLVGEFFVLEALAGDRNNPFAHMPHPWMPEAAWRTRSRATADFVIRARQNFADHESIAQIAIIVGGVMESWELAALDVWSKAQRSTRGLAAAGEMLRSSAPTDLGAARALAGLTLASISLCFEATEPLACRVLLDHLAELCAAYPGERELREAWAGGVANFVHGCAVKDDIGRRAPLDDLEGLHAARQDELRYPEGWESRLIAFYDTGYAGEDPTDCRALLDSLAELHAAHPDEPALRANWASSVSHFIARHVRGDATHCRALLDELAGVHTRHPGEPELRERWALGVAGFIAQRAGEDAEGCRVLLDELGALHVAQRGEPALREAWGLGVANFITHCAAQDAVGCRALLKELAALHMAQPDEPALREAWAVGVLSFVTDRAVVDPLGCRALLEALTGLSDGHPGEPVLRERWAKSASNFIVDRGAEDAVGCRVLLDDLARVSAGYPGEPVLREQWAMSVRNFVVHRGAEDAVGCRALLDDLARVSTGYPGEPVLREQWGSGVFSFVAHRAAKDAAGCRTLLEDLVGLVSSYRGEASLVEYAVLAGATWIAECGQNDKASTESVWNLVFSAAQSKEIIESVLHRVGQL
jgi:DNA polymerase III epsilon subunit-like protein